MPRFNARLYNLLVRVRKRREDVQATQLAETRQSIHACTVSRDGLLAQRRAQLETAMARTHSDFDASDVRRFYQHERHLAQLSDLKDAELHGLEQKAESERGELEAAMKSRKVAEGLQERKTAQYREALDKEEKQQLDEAALMHRTYSRSQGEAASHGTKR